MKKIVFILLIIALVFGAMIMKKDNQQEVVGNLETEISLTKSQELKAEESEEKVISVSIKEELDERLKELPTMGELKNLSEEEVHHTPAMIREGGAILGKIHAEAEENPERRPDTLAFFKECAEDEEVVTSLRAVCWNKVMTLIPQWQIFLPIADAKVSDEVKNLASQL